MPSEHATRIVLPPGPKATRVMGLACENFGSRERLVAVSQSWASESQPEVTSSDPSLLNAA